MVSQGPGFLTERPIPATMNNGLQIVSSDRGIKGYLLCAAFGTNIDMDECGLEVEPGFHMTPIWLQDPEIFLLAKASM